MDMSFDGMGKGPDDDKGFPDVGGREVSDE